jgi:Ca2+-binding RTX toxin-like protein
MRMRRFLAALVATYCAALASASIASAQELLFGADGAQGNPSNLYRLDPGSGAVLQNVGPIGFPITGLAEDPSTGILYGSTGRGPSSSGDGLLVRIDEQTGAGTLIGDLRPDPDNETAADITFTPDGTLFGWLEPNSDDLVTINKGTGAATIVGDSGISTEGTGLASDSAGTLFLADDSSPLWTINRTTGAATQVATLNASGDTPALAFNSQVQISPNVTFAPNTLFGVRSQKDASRTTALITINTASGAVNSWGPSVNRLDAIEFATLPVPSQAAAGTCRGLTANIVGTPGNDVRTGTPGRDVMLGLEGNDTLRGLAGNDVICGANGNDRLNGGKGKDTLLGQKGNDKLKGGPGKDKLSGKKGKDTLKGGGGSDKLKGGGGRDVCIGGKANDSASKCEVEKSI